MNTRYQAILFRFPEYTERILMLISENPDFECLCSDYGECIDLIASLTEPGRSEFIFEQYMELKTELELEVKKFLSVEN